MLDRLWLTPERVRAMAEGLRAVAAQDDVVRGRALFQDLGCVHCHAEAAPTSLTAQSLSGPDLRGAGKRLDPTWVARWLEQPHDVTPGTRMPALLADGSGRAGQARDIAAYLAAYGK